MSRQTLKEASARFAAIAAAIPALRKRAKDAEAEAAGSERIHREFPTPEGEVVLMAERAIALECRLAVAVALDDLEDARIECAAAWESRREDFPRPFSVLEAEGKS